MIPWCPCTPSVRLYLLQCILRGVLVFSPSSSTLLKTTTAFILKLLSLHVITEKTDIVFIRDNGCQCEGSGSKSFFFHLPPTYSFRCFYITVNLGRWKQKLQGSSHTDGCTTGFELVLMLLSPEVNTHTHARTHTGGEAWDDLLLFGQLHSFPAILFIAHKQWTLDRQPLVSCRQLQGTLMWWQFSCARANVPLSDVTCFPPPPPIPLQAAGRRTLKSGWWTSCWVRSVTTNWSGRLSTRASRWPSPSKCLCLSSSASYVSISHTYKHPFSRRQLTLLLSNTLFFSKHWCFFSPPFMTAVVFEADLLSSCKTAASGAWML